MQYVLNWMPCASYRALSRCRDVMILNTGVVEK